MPTMHGVPVPETPAESSKRLRWALVTAFWPWVLSRLLVGGALAIAHELVNEAHLSKAAEARVRQGLLGWDAGWYETIARHGYAGAGHQSLRFFPLVPALARAVSVLPGVGVGAALVAVANLSALVGTALLVVLAARETGDVQLARRTAWLLCLAPPAFTMVMGYAEATLLCFTVGTFWALREQRWWLAAVLGVGAGLCRPVGVLLVVPAVIEGARRWRGSAVSDRCKILAAVLGPAVGFGAFLGWVQWRYGDGLAPLEIQEQGTHRGPVANPFTTLGRDASYLLHGHHLGSALHLPWALLALCLVAVSFRKWPACYGAFAAAVLLVALTSANLDGLERYALSGFPLVLAGAGLTSSGRVERAVLVLAGGGLVGYSLLAFVNLYVP